MNQKYNVGRDLGIELGEVLKWELKKLSIKKKRYDYIRFLAKYARLEDHIPNIRYIPGVSGILCLDSEENTWKPSVTHCLTHLITLRMSSHR